MSGRAGRDRSRRDYPTRSAEKSNHGRNNPPSRHLWVGNLSHNIAESSLTDLFLHFGELESVACQPGRSYAFINFKNEEDAFAAMRELQGFIVGGNPLKIEFTKAEKSSTPSLDEEYFQRRDQQHSTGRGSPYSQRDTRIRHYSPDQSYPDKSKMTDRNAAPSEVLWIGFPALLKVDEIILRRAFSPFGEIEKITTFPGRSYAFVRFKNIMAACRAKETLQGKLFDNPRVHICFAKSESGTSNSGRSSMNAPPSPHFRQCGHPESPETFRPDRKYGNVNEFISNVDSGDPETLNYSRKRNLWSGGNGEFKQRRIQEVDPEFGLPGNMYEHRSSSPTDRASHFHDFSRRFPQQGPFYDDSWDLPEDLLPFHGAKKLEISPFPPENELPEYPFTDDEQMKRTIPRSFPDFPKPEVFDKNYDSGHFGYKQLSAGAANSNQPYGERDRLNAHYDGVQSGLLSHSPNPIEWKRSNPESQHSSSSGEWKWEGTIAKGGTPVCRARCFPVGKAMDMVLPDFLDCTARTSLDMLAKHYYQAASAWVVFFVPHSDADIGFYNEFMNYLGEKQRAAVAKLDEKATLFLVPPSEFSEKILKVPGKLSISGVILRLEHLGSNFASRHHPNEKQDPNLLSFHGDSSYAKLTSSLGSYSTDPSRGKSGLSSTSFPGDLSAAAPRVVFSNTAHAYGKMSNSIAENKHEYALNQRSPILGPNWSPHNPLNTNAASRNMVPQPSSSAVDTVVQGYNAVIPKAVQETDSSSYTAGMSGNPLPRSGKLPIQDTRPPVSSSTSVAALQPEQLAQLASSLLGQQGQSGGINMEEEFRQSNTVLQPENSYRTANMYGLPNNQVRVGMSSSQFSQVYSLQQQQQVSSGPVMPPRELQASAPPNEQLQGTGVQAEADADPQKRLQATLQLAAALLQQIQQGKGN